METVQQLKDQARTLERGGHDRAALDLYSRIRELEHQDDPSVLFRMGNLQRRLGRGPEAVESYARTLEILIRAGLRNSALAVCRRILNMDPEHEEAGLRLAELAAEAGYAQDSRSASLGFAARMEARGEDGAARSALQSHLRAFPEDIEVRRYLIERLQSHGGVEEAVEEMRSLEALLRRRGDAAEAAAVAVEMRRLGPSAGRSDLDDAVPMGMGAGDLDLLSLEPEPEAGPDLDILPTVLDEAGSEPVAVSPLEGLEPTRMEGLEPTFSGMDWDDAPGGPDDALPILGNEPEADEAGPGGGEDLPLLGLEPVPEHGGDDLSVLMRRVEDAAREDDPSRLVEALLALGRRLAGVDPARAREVYQQVLDLDAGNPEARRALADPAQ